MYHKETGNYIVVVEMTPDLFVRYAPFNPVPQSEKVVFDKDSSVVRVPVFMTPEEYCNYAKHKTLPQR